MTRSDEPRSNLSVGMAWASRITSVGLEFAVPPLLGALIDHGIGTSPALLLLGAVLGFALGIRRVLSFARDGARP